MTEMGNDPASPRPPPIVRPARPGQRRLHPFLTSVVSVLLSGLAAEAVCRVVLPPVREFWPAGMFQRDPDPAIGFRLTPGFSCRVRNLRLTYTSTTNSLGFRGEEPSFGPTRRVAAVFGDSFTFGMGVENHETFTAAVRARLAPSGWEVLNTGVPTYGPAQEFGVYEDLCRRHRIDTVILQLFQNDVIDQERPPEYGVYQGILYQHVPATWWEKAGAWVLRRSELLAQVKFHIGRRGSDSRMPDYLSAGFEREAASEIRSTTALLERWCARARERHQRMIVLYIPRSEQVEPQWQPQIERWRREGKQVDLDAAHRSLAAFVKSRTDVSYVDVVEAFRADYRRGGPPLYLSGDLHTNAVGHRRIAGLLINELAGPVSGRSHAPGSGS